MRYEMNFYQLHIIQSSPFIIYHKQKTINLMNL